MPGNRQTCGRSCGWFADRTLHGPGPNKPGQARFATGSPRSREGARSVGRLATPGVPRALGLIQGAPEKGKGEARRPKHAAPGPRSVGEMIKRRMGKGAVHGLQYQAQASRAFAHRAAFPLAATCAQAEWWAKACIAVPE